MDIRKKFWDNLASLIKDMQVEINAIRSVNNESLEKNELLLKELVAQGKEQQARFLAI